MGGGGSGGGVDSMTARGAGAAGPGLRRLTPPPQRGHRRGDAGAAGGDLLVAGEVAPEERQTIAVAHARGIDHRDAAGHDPTDPPPAIAVVAQPDGDQRDVGRGAEIQVDLRHRGIVEALPCPGQRLPPRAVHHEKDRASGFHRNRTEQLSYRPPRR
jgi:hypothetical protein